MAVIDWLLDSDPAIRWQVMRDLTHEPADTIAAERARIATEGWGARLLALQGPDGQWGGRPWSHDYTDTFHVLELLRRLGLDPGKRAGQAGRRARARPHHLAGSRVRDALGGPPVLRRARWSRASTATPSRPARTSAWTWRRSSSDSSGEQLADGGWNCEVENGATVSSLETTINVLEGLLEYERAIGGSAEVAEARRARRGATCSSAGCTSGSRPARSSISTGSASRTRTGTTTTSCERSTTCATPGVTPDDRVADALTVVERQRDPAGRWPLQNIRAGASHIVMEDGEGTPSRWNTLRAMRVLAWAEQG